MKKPLTGRVARLGACAAAAGLVAVGTTATPALADSDQLWIAANPYELVLPNVVDGTQQAPAVTLALGLYHDNPGHRVTDGRLTVDISGLAGIAEVTWPENCAPAGTTAVCSLPEVPVNSSTPVKLQVRAVAGAADGATGRIAYQAEATTTAEGGRLTAAENGTDFRVASGPDLVLDRPAPVTGVTPGSTVPVGLSVANHGNRPAQGVELSLYVTRGLDLTGLPPQCTATPLGEGGTVKPLTRFDCAFDDVVPPGGTFTLPTPPTAKVAPYALAERVDIGVRPGGGAEDLQPEGNGALLDVTAVNTADFAVRGAKLTAEAGRTVTVPVTFRNRGPAWVANLTSGDPVADVDVTVPRGATATAVPDACEPRTADGGWWESEVRTGAPRYLCRMPIWVAEQQTVTLPFALRIDTVVTGAKGAVVLKPPYGDTPLPFDPNRKNDQAKIVLNPAS